MEKTIKFITKCSKNNYIKFKNNYIKFNLKVQQTVTSANGVKRRMVTLQSPTKKKCVLQLWREQVILGDKIGMSKNLLNISVD